MFQFSTPRHRGHASVLAIDEKVRDRRGATAGVVYVHAFWFSACF